MSECANCGKDSYGLNSKGDFICFPRVFLLPQALYIKDGKNDSGN